MSPTIPQQPPARAPANGIELCYEIFGEAHDPAILLIMGLGAQMIVWDDDFCIELASRGYRVIRFDNRDIGESTRFTEAVKIDLPALMMMQMRGERIPAPYLLRDMADDAAGLLDAVGIRSAHIVGASMGGMIAQELAIRHPSRVLTLTSIMSHPGDPHLPPPTPEAAAVLMAPPPKSEAEYLEAHAKTWRVLRGPGFPLDEAKDRVQAARAFARGLNPPGVARQLLAIFASGDRTGALASVKMPTLVIHGAADPLVKVEGGKATAAAIPGARLLIIEGMGHAVPIPMWPQIIGAIAAHAR